jgi:hypothetical protein
MEKKGVKIHKKMSEMKYCRPQSDTKESCSGAVLLRTLRFSD